jgi:hypothetical protein
MFPSTVPEYLDNDLIGTDATTGDDNFDRRHPLYKTIQTYSELYREHPALQSGAQIDRYAADGPGVYAFSRIDRRRHVEYLVAFNNADTAQTVTVPTDSPSTRFEELDTDPAHGKSWFRSWFHHWGRDKVRSDADGNLTIEVPAFGVSIHRAERRVAAGGPPTVAISTLTDGQVVQLATTSMDGHDVVDRLEIGADVDSSGPVEVTFAVRPTGTTEWTVVGTDDNAPHRVFADTTAWPDRTPLDVVAVVRDSVGRLVSSEVSGVVTTTDVPEPETEIPYAVVHYQRTDGDYDPWGLHAWGDLDEVIEWTSPKPFAGEDEYGRFAWLDLAPGATNVGFIVHSGDVKDGTDADRFFDPSVTPEIWLKGGDATIYTSQAAAQGYVTIHYQRPDGDYTDWGLHLWGDAIAPSEVTDWAAPKPPTTIDDFGASWTVAIQNTDSPVNFIIHRGDEKDPGPRPVVRPRRAGIGVDPVRRRHRLRRPRRRGR